MAALHTRTSTFIHTHASTLISIMSGKPAARLLRPSVDAHRLRWIVRDVPFEEAIEIVEDAFDSDSPEEPYKSEETGELHTIRASSISVTPRKELTVTLPALYNYILYDECPDDHSDYEEEGGGRPYDEPKCEIKAANGEFITIGEYIDAVYPWLVSLRERYLRDAPVPGTDLPDNVLLSVIPSTILGGIELLAVEPPRDNPDVPEWWWTQNEPDLSRMWLSMAQTAWNIHHDWPESGEQERALKQAEEANELITESLRAQNLE